MARSFNDLKQKMSPAARKEVARKSAELAAEMPLHELRQALRLSQAQLAETLKVKQPAISKMEHSTDMYLSTLSRFVTAMGGELDIVARFPDGEVRINQFKDIDNDTSARAA